MQIFASARTGRFIAAEPAVALCLRLITNNFSAASFFVRLLNALPRVERLSNFGTVHWRLKLFMAEKKTKENQSGTGAAHAQSPAVEQKPNVYEAEYMGSGTFRIVKPKRKEAKRRQSRLKGTTRGSRK